MIIKLFIKFLLRLNKNELLDYLNIYDRILHKECIFKIRKEYEMNTNKSYAPVTFYGRKIVSLQNPPTKEEVMQIVTTEKEKRLNDKNNAPKIWRRPMYGHGVRINEKGELVNWIGSRERNA